MANELQAQYQAGVAVYAIIRNRIGQVWSTTAVAFVSYASIDYLNYVISLTEQGTASGFYAGNFPSAITPGVYSIVAHRRVGTAGNEAETDPSIATGDYQWNGTVTLPLSDLATSGQLGQVSPIRLARGVQIANFPLYFKSSADHVTPLTSGIVSGQIARDGGSFGALQSGAFLETGLGFYTLQALTSGDLLANTVKLLFTANQVSGGPSDPLPMSFVLQRTSGQ